MSKKGGGEIKQPIVMTQDGNVGIGRIYSTMLKIPEKQELCLHLQGKLQVLCKCQKQFQLVHVDFGSTWSKACRDSRVGSVNQPVGRTY